MLTTDLITRALNLANLQNDDPDLRDEAKESLKEGIRHYSKDLGYAQDVIEYHPESESFTIGKPINRKGKNCHYTYDTLPSLDDYATCGYVKDKDCIYRESDDTFYKIVQTGEDEYAWQTFISSDYATYFQITPDVIVMDLDSITSIVCNSYNLRNVNLNVYLRGTGDYVVQNVAESIYKITVREEYTREDSKDLQIIYGKLVTITNNTNILLTNDYLDLLVGYVSYNVAKTTEMKATLGTKLAEIESKVLNTNEEDSYLITPDYVL